MIGTEHDVKQLREWFKPLDDEMFQHILNEVEKAIKSWGSDTLEAAKQLDELYFWEWAIDAELYQLLEGWGE